MSNFLFSFNENSSNKKTGAMPVTRTDKKSCPVNCPLLGNGCYAAIGRTNIWWSKLDTIGLTIDQLADKIRRIKPRSLWRHNEAGDLPHIGDGQTIDRNQLEKIVKANNGKRGFTYTHFPLTPENVATILAANNDGFTVNISANSIEELDNAVAHGLPSVVIVSDTITVNKFTTTGGNDVIICPNQLKDKITCLDCGLCQKRDRNFSIAFKAHGIGKNKVKKTLSI